MRPSRKIEDLGISDLCPVMVELSMAGTAWPMQLPHGGVLYFPMVAKIGILPDCIELYRVSSHRGHRYYREEFIALEIECMY